MIGVRVSDETKTQITNRLEYGDSQSEWVRTAIHIRLELEALAEAGALADIESLEDLESIPDGDTDENFNTHSGAALSD